MAQNQPLWSLSAVGGADHSESGKPDMITGQLGTALGRNVNG